MAKLNAEQVFRAKAPGIMAQLVRDFPITPTDAAAIRSDQPTASPALSAKRQ